MLKASSSAGSADGQPVNFQRGNSDADGNGLAVLAAGSDAFVELQIVADHGNLGQHVGAVAEGRRFWGGGGGGPVLDRVALGRGKDDFPVGDANLPAAKIH